jgi:hypothetical protein
VGSMCELSATVVDLCKKNAVPATGNGLPMNRASCVQSFSHTVYVSHLFNFVSVKLISYMHCEKENLN